MRVGAITMADVDRFVKATLSSGIIMYVISLHVPYSFLQIDLSTLEASIIINPAFIMTAVATLCLLGASLSTTTAFLFNNWYYNKRTAALKEELARYEYGSSDLGSESCDIDG
jgi:hypothetical protein